MLIIITLSFSADGYMIIVSIFGERAFVLLS
jgi:hypothetical protein